MSSPRPGGRTSWLRCRVERRIQLVSAVQVRLAVPDIGAEVAIENVLAVDVDRQVDRAVGAGVVDVVIEMGEPKNVNGRHGRSSSAGR
jgi:hypothetical protein